MTGRPPRPSRLHDLGVVLILLGAMMADSQAVVIPAALLVTGLVLVVVSQGRWFGRRRQRLDVGSGRREDGRQPAGTASAQHL